MVACPFRRSGCEFIGQLQILKSHKKNCDFNPENLPTFLKHDDNAFIPVTAAAAEDNPFCDLGAVPSPEKPSLKMRLFRAGDNKKKLLSSMFEHAHK